MQQRDPGCNDFTTLLKQRQAFMENGVARRGNEETEGLKAPEAGFAHGHV